MTTITLNGLQVDYLDDDAQSVGTVEIVLVLPSASATFSYFVDYYNDDGDPIVEFSDTIIEGYVAGVSIDDTDFDTVIMQVSWGSGNTSTILGLSWDTGGDTASDAYFVLGGDPLPEITSVADWQNFDDMITSMGLASGQYAPNRDILWTEFEDYSITEDDEFYGTSGRDKLNGGIGDDYFVSSARNDTYNGGKGVDQVTFANDPGGVYANLKTGTATDGWGNTDTLNSIEVLRGSAFDDKLIGKSGHNVLRGLAGDDVLNGGAGLDEVRYDRDARYGGSDGVTVNLKSGFAIDGFGNRDTLKSIEEVRGSDTNDKITGTGGRNQLEGEAGNDKLFGLNGSDKLYGGAGRDVIDGGAGNDKLYGEGGADRFVFSGNFGNDTIFDFQLAGTKEKIDLSDINEIISFRDLKNHHLSMVNGDAVISDDDGHTVTLDGIARADLSADDFIF
ncbi:hypothetical protein AYJ57_25300 (plasmid) [Salipiger sp. CCB-MM3]|uniref:calcium-binding protein n=1 Tax=Salipiger sp. CCB-MM3 TaxID=1792508 RepID=UPI00080A9957|nr:calcium-binding protein [Salipiger sp. CCB-MM3]ANT63794.1 hypothetical protein AYJ57_25300 [Salipiger sp. CCB-MM3]